LNGFTQRAQRISRKGRKGFHAKGAKDFTQRAQRDSRKGRKGFHAKGAMNFTQWFFYSLRALRVLRVLCVKKKSLLIYNIITLNGFTQRAQRISRKGRKDFHAKDAKIFRQRAQRFSRKERNDFHAKGAKIFTQRAQRVQVNGFLFFVCSAWKIQIAHNWYSRRKKSKLFYVNGTKQS